jgi:type IV pilus assembly protein PilX
MTRADTDKSVHGCRGSCAGQRGLVLPVALILLLIVTLLSIAGIHTTGMQERISGNMRDRSLAFQSAESALRSAEQAVTDGTAMTGDRAEWPGDVDYWNGCWDGSVNDCPPATEHVVAIDDWGIAARASYRVERLRAGSFGSLAADDALASAPLYRITVRAVGGTVDSVVILQTTYRP